MKYAKLFLCFLIAGIAVLLTGIYINSSAIGDGNCLGGACPGIPVSTVPSISVGGLLALSGTALIIVALVVGLYGYFSDSKNAKPAKLEPQPAQVNS